MPLKLLSSACSETTMHLTLKTIFFIIISIKIITVNPYFYNGNNATKGFHNYRLWFNKKYENNKDQDRAFNNFIDNFNIVSDLNDKLVNSTKVYILNQHADVNPEDFEEHYAVTVKPYDLVDRDEMALRTKENSTKLIGDLQLYDLVNADELYRQYMMKYDKKNATKEKYRMAHYYRFIKTLVELNKNKMEGKTPVTLDDQADVVKQPNEYFFKARD